MSQHSPNPTPDQLAAMAYVDGELPSVERAAFEARLEREPDLALEVASLRKLEILTRRLAPAEPIDTEWRRLELDPMQRTMGGLGLGLLFLMAFGGTLWLFVLVIQGDMELFPKTLLLGGMIGVVLLLLSALRARLRTLPYDPYTHVER